MEVPLSHHFEKNGILPYEKKKKKKENMERNDKFVKDVAKVIVFPTFHPK